MKEDKNSIFGDISSVIQMNVSVMVVINDSKKDHIHRYTWYFKNQSDENIANFKNNGKHTELITQLVLKYHLFL